MASSQTAPSSARAGNSTATRQCWRDDPWSLMPCMISPDMEETRRGEVVIKDLDSDTVGKMLAYVYTGKVEEIEAKAAELLAAAEKYILPELKMMSEEALCRTMKIDNVLDMLVLADLHKDSNVKSVAMKFMLENALVSQDAENLKKKVGKYPDILVEMFVAATNSNS